MRELNFNVPTDSRPHYLRIAEALRLAIREGQARGGESIPSTRALAQVLKVHRHTVMSALDELVAEGWLIAKERQTYQICEALPSQFFEPEVNQSQKAIPTTSSQQEWRIVRTAGMGLSWTSEASQREIKYGFFSGQPDLRLFPHAEFRSILSESLKRNPLKVLNYGDPAGYPPFIEAVKMYLRRMRAVANRELVVTHGSQEGIFLAAQMLVKPGEKVAVEALGYRPAWEALKAAGARLIPIAIDSEGLDPDSLGKILKKNQIRLIYTTPLHQYPTTTTLPLARRVRLYELAVRYGVPLLEDDYDHEFHYRSQPLAPLASRDPAGLVIYISTFSKVLFPSARLGFMAVPDGTLFKSLTSFRRIMTRQNDCLIQDPVARWMASDGFERHLRRMRRAYEERLNTILECVEKAQQAGLLISCQSPDGGMAIWLKTERDSKQTADAALKRGVHVTPEQNFQLKPTRGTHLRLGFANQSPGEIRRGMELLFSVFKL